MVRSGRCNLHPDHIAGTQEKSLKLSPTTSPEDALRHKELLRKAGEDPLDPGATSSSTVLRGF